MDYIFFNVAVILQTLKIKHLCPKGKYLLIIST